MKRLSAQISDRTWAFLERHGIAAAIVGIGLAVLISAPLLGGWEAKVEAAAGIALIIAGPSAGKEITKWLLKK